MSKQLEVGDKRKQSYMTGFFKPVGNIASKPRVETYVGGRVRSVDCRYCGLSFSTQGIKSHEEAHEKRGEKPDASRRPKFGKVKVTGPPPSQPRAESTSIDVDDDDEYVPALNPIVIIDANGKVHESVAKESGNVVVLPKSSTASNLSVADKIEILDYYHACVREKKEWPKAATRKWVKGQARFRRPKFHRKDLNRMIQNERTIRNQAGTKRDSKYVTSQKRDGMYPDMEIRLHSWILETRNLGIPVETFMLPIVGRELMLELYPEMYRDQDSPDFKEPFMFSDKWRSGFFSRFKLALRKFTAKKSILRDKEKVKEHVREFHLDTRSFQMSKPIDPTYGIAPPQGVWNHDQVPIAMCSSEAKTVDERGNLTILNSLDMDNKRFCTLNLAIPMEVRPDHSNLPKPHLVFRGTFKGGEDWADEEERAQWDPRVVVSFQPKAWVDTDTHLYWLDNVMKPIDNWLEMQEFDGVMFEDNLGVHHTDKAAEHWKEELPNFHDPRFYPKNLTLLIQAIDRHIGIQYKNAVTKAVRKVPVERMEEAKRAGTEFDASKAFSAAEKRILITKVVAEEHERLASLLTFKRAFLATGTWMPIENLLAADGAANGSADLEVSLQGMEKDYDYRTLCSRAEVFSYKAKADEEAERAAAEKRRIELEEKAAAEALATKLACWNASGLEMLNCIETELNESCRSVVESLATYFDGHFVIGGSFPAMKLTEVISRVVDAVENPVKSDLPIDFFHLNLPSLKANDIDVYHGQYGDGPLVISKLDGAISRVDVDGIDEEVNTVRCLKFSGSAFLDNNDINATAVCIEATQDGFKFKVHPTYWEFLLSYPDRILKPSRTGVRAKTLVRLAFKSYELGIPFDDKDPSGVPIDAQSEPIYKSHVDKINKMKDWKDSPFRRMRVEQKTNGFLLKMLATKVDCEECKAGRANKQCKKLLCKKCCLADETVTKCAAHGKGA